jgi:hypothetical protein
MEARFPLHNAGVYLGAVRTGNGDVLPLAALTLPYSPEFEPRLDPKEGQKTLGQMARVTGGIERTAWDDVFDASRLRNRQIRELVIPLALLLLVLHVAEVGGRRLLLFAAANGRLRMVSLPRLRWARTPRPTSASDSIRTPSSPTPPAPAADPPPRVATPKPATSPLTRAKAKSRDRMGG